MAPTKITIDICRELARDKGGYCISTEYISRQKLTWVCCFGHTWGATFENIKAGRWCPECAGVKKRTIEYAHQLAASFDGYCLSKEYINNEEPMQWKCNKGHEWNSPLHRVVSGSWCLECFKLSHLHNIEEAIELAKVNSGFCLSKEPFVYADILTWQCKDGHIWDAQVTKIKNGSWCKICYELEVFNKQVDKLNAILDKKNAILLSPYVNIKTPVKIQCSKGHIFEKDPRYIFGRSWCPDCAPESRMGYGRKSLITIEYVKELAIQKGGLCLSDEYINDEKPLKWQCANGHIWDMPLFQFRRDTWCQECFKAARRQRGLDKITAVLNERGIMIISGEYINNQSLFVVRCSKGHEWETNSSRVYTNKGCPTCNSAGKVSRQKLLTILQSIFPGHEIKVNHRGIPWLIGPGGGRMELDFYLPNLSLAIEYDGRQHYEIVNFAGSMDLAKKEFELIQTRDALKDKLMFDHQDEIHRFIRIPYTAPLTEDGIKELLGQSVI